jgi:hypothetical protein
LKQYRLLCESAKPDMATNPSDGAKPQKPSAPIAMKDPTLLEILRIALIVAWLSLLVPWLYLAPASFMAFDGGDALHVRFFVLSICTYPVAVVIALLLRNKKPWLLLLPCINLAGCSFRFGHLTS